MDVWRKERKVVSDVPLAYKIWAPQATSTTLYDDTGHTMGHTTSRSAVRTALPGMAERSDTLHDLA